jgi:hypothetical protein
LGQPEATQKGKNGERQIIDENWKAEAVKHLWFYYILSQVHDLQKKFFKTADAILPQPRAQRPPAPSLAAP